MNVTERIREIVVAGGGRAPVATLVRDALGLQNVPPSVARQLLAAAVQLARGLAIEGEEVVERAEPPPGRVVALALAPATSATALPASAAHVTLPLGGEAPTVIALAAGDWRAGVTQLARDLAGSQVLALSAASARRVLALGRSLSRDLAEDDGDEPDIVAIGPIARRAGCPIRTAEEAAALVGADVPETPEGAALLMARLCERLAEMTGLPLERLREIADAETVPPFDFGDRAFAREHVLALPEAPGVYVFEDASGEIAYVGKAKNLRRRVSSYFTVQIDERAERVRQAAHELSTERTGSELSALLREQQLIRELLPRLNTVARVHARERSAPAQFGATGPVAVIQPSAGGGAEIVLLDRVRGASVLAVVPDADDTMALATVRQAVADLRLAEGGPGERGDVEVALTWLADSGQDASVVDASGEIEEVARLIVRIARDPDLARGKIVPVT